MRDRNLLGRRWVRALLAALLAGAVGLGVFLAARDEAVEPTPANLGDPAEREPAPPAENEAGASDESEEGRDGGRGERGPQPDPAEDERPADRRRSAERDAARAYERYVEAINDRDGEELCALLAPGFEQQLKPPVRRATCPETLRASVGHEQRGRPVWERTVLVGVSPQAADRDHVRITAEIITEFADRTEPSVESDLAYLTRAGDGWVLAKATGALHRAVGKPDFPPRVISPPPVWPG